MMNNFLNVNYFFFFYIIECFCLIFFFSLLIFFCFFINVIKIIKYNFSFFLCNIFLFWLIFCYYNLKMEMNIIFLNKIIFYYKICFIFCFFFCLLNLYNFYMEYNVLISDIFLSFILILFSGLNIMMFMNWMCIYIFIEIFSFMLYIIVTGLKKNVISIEGGFKFFLIGTFNSILFLFGSIIYYGFFGISDFKEIYYILLNEGLLNIYIIGIFVGLGFLINFFFFKLLIVPYHKWAADVYDSSYSNVLVSIMILPKYIFCILFMYFIVILNLDYFYVFRKIFFFFFILTICVGIFWGLFQFKFKRFLAYSSIVNLGLIFIVLVNNFWESNIIFFIFFLNYIILVFSLVNNFILIKELKSLNYFKEMILIKDFLFVVRENILYSMLVVSVFLSLLGMPPFLGFFSKFLLFKFLIKYGGILLVVFILIIFLISGFYYLRLIKLFCEFYILYLNYRIFLILNKFLIIINLFFIYINSMYMFFFDWIYLMLVNFSIFNIYWF